MKQRRNYTISYCICPECSCNFPIPRKKNQYREKGHIKDIWCPFCKKINKFVEHRDVDADVNVGVDSDVELKQTRIIYVNCRGESEEILWRKKKLKNQVL